MLYKIAGGLFFAAALAKFISVSGHARILYTYDPVFFMLTTRTFLLFVAICEVCAGYVLVFEKSQLFKWTTLFLMCMCFWCYRIGILIVNPGKPCPCLGTIFDWSPWLKAHEQSTALVILLFLTLSLFVKKTDSLLHRSGFDGEHATNLPPKNSLKQLDVPLTIKFPPNIRR